MPLAVAVMDMPPAYAEGNQGGGGNGDNGNGGAGNDGGHDDGDHDDGDDRSDKSSSGKSYAAGKSGSTGTTIVIDPSVYEDRQAPERDVSSNVKKPTTTAPKTVAKAPAPVVVAKPAPAAQGGADQKVTTAKAAPAPKAPVAAGQVDAADDMATLYIKLTGEDDSDRPDWAMIPGGRDSAGGGQPDNAGSTKGDLFGDLYVILRDDNGVPILNEDGYVQPLDAEGNLIALDDEGQPIDATLAQEVEIGRLNVGRAPVSVLENRAEEVVGLLNDADALTTDAAGRLVITVGEDDYTIDSPLENLAIYVALMTEGTIPGVDDLPGTDFDFMVDGTFTQEDLAGSVPFLAAATDKTNEFAVDEIAYINAFLGVNIETDGSVTYADIDYADFTYDRLETYGDVTVDVLVQQEDGSWVPQTVSIYDMVFDNQDLEAGGTLEAYTLAADDAVSVVNFIHEYEVPESYETFTH
jgi:hypothetical protein